MTQDQGASAKADRAATPSEPSQSSVVSGVAGIPCAFTPGPWKVHTYNQGHLLGYVQGAPVDGERYGDAVVLKLAKPTSARSHANARLIAAAPELYEALATFVALLDKGEGSLSHDLEYAMRDALAKARGQ